MFSITHLFVLQFAEVHRCNLVLGDLHVALNAFLYELNYKKQSAFPLSSSKIVQMKKKIVQMNCPLGGWVPSLKSSLQLQPSTLGAKCVISLVITSAIVLNPWGEVCYLSSHHYIFSPQPLGGSVLSL